MHVRLTPVYCFACCPLMPCSVVLLLFAVIHPSYSTRALCLLFVNQFSSFAWLLSDKATHGLSASITAHHKHQHKQEIQKMGQEHSKMEFNASYRAVVSPFSIVLTEIVLSAPIYLSVYVHSVGPSPVQTQIFFTINTHSLSCSCSSRYSTSDDVKNPVLISATGGLPPASVSLLSRRR